MTRVARRLLLMALWARALAMVIMTDKRNKNAKSKGKSLSPNEVSELLRNFYQPEESSIQNFDEFYIQLRNKIDGAKFENAATDKRNSIQEDYNRREEQLQKMLADIDVSGRTSIKRKSARLTRLAVVLLLASALVAAGVLAYKYMHQVKPLAAETKLSTEQSKKLSQIDAEWQNFKTQQLLRIEESQNKFNLEMRKDKPDTNVVAVYERELLEAKAALSAAKTRMLLSKKAVKA